MYRIPIQVVSAATPKLGSMIAAQLESIIEDEMQMENQNISALAMIRDWLRNNASEDVWAEPVANAMVELSEEITNFLENFYV